MDGVAVCAATIPAVSGIAWAPRPAWAPSVAELASSALSAFDRPAVPIYPFSDNRVAVAAEPAWAPSVAELAPTAVSTNLPRG